MIYSHRFVDAARALCCRPPSHVVEVHPSHPNSPKNNALRRKIRMITITMIMMMLTKKTRKKKEHTEEDDEEEGD